MKRSAFRFLSVLLVLTLALAVLGCSSSPPPRQSQPNQAKQSTPTVAPAPAPAPAPATQKDVTVYVTKTGAKYHAAGCRYLSKSQIPISLKDAKARGYTPCSVCNPPR